MTKQGIVVVILILLLLMAVGYLIFLSPQKTVDLTPVVKGECYIGGCSAQICSDKPDQASSCEFRPEYSCYKGATCERQANGECGWTQTSELKSCLQNPPAL